MNMNFQANVCLMYQLKPITSNWQNHGHYLWPGTLLLIWSDCQPNANCSWMCLILTLATNMDPAWRTKWAKKIHWICFKSKTTWKGVFVHKLERNFDEKNMGFISIIRQQNSSWKNRDVCYKCYMLAGTSNIVWEILQTSTIHSCRFLEFFFIIGVLRFSKILNCM